jgi:hypothetical protein
MMKYKYKFRNFGSISTDWSSYGISERIRSCIPTVPGPWREVWNNSRREGQGVPPEIPLGMLIAVWICHSGRLTWKPTNAVVTNGRRNMISDE